jgi:hypothetical protein
LLVFKKEIDDLIEYSFNSNIKFEKGRDLSFQNFLNQSKFAPKYMATYTDNMLKKGIMGKNTQEVDKMLSSVVRLFCCLNDRDIFIKELENFLHYRLLDKTITSREAEEMMI